MREFFEISPTLRGLILLVNMLMMYDCIYMTAKLYRYRRAAVSVVPGAALILADFAFFQLMLNQNRGHGTSIPCYMAVVILWMAAFGLFIYRERTKIKSLKQSSVTPMSIKEALDMLPAGLCFYYPDGRCRLVNLSMDRASRVITGESLRDGKKFWDGLLSGNIRNGTVSEVKGELVVTLNGGDTVYSFGRTEIVSDKEKLYEITCTDVTQEYGLGRELREANEKAADINRRLLILNENISELTVRREILDSKVRLHDEWGRALLQLRRGVTENDGETCLAAVKSFQNNILLLEAERTLSHDGSQSNVIEDAATIGVKVTIDGELPVQPELYGIAEQAITVCVSNALQHANATEVFVNCEADGSVVRISISNNGSTPDCEITERGGLLNLRRRVEGASGVMKVRSVPEFLLEIRFDFFDTDNQERKWLTEY